MSKSGVFQLAVSEGLQCQEYSQGPFIYDRATSSCYLFPLQITEFLGPRKVYHRKIFGLSTLGMASEAGIQKRGYLKQANQVVSDLP